MMNTILVNCMDLLQHTTACYLTIAIIVLTTLHFLYKNWGLPPGPKGLPFIGYWPFLRTTTCHLQLQELGRKYGDIYSFTVTGYLYVNLGSFKANREAFILKSDYFADRMTDFSLGNFIFRGSLIFLNGEEWKTNRKFFLQQFRELGITNIKGATCGSIYDSVQETIKDLCLTDGKPTEIIQMLTDKCTKVLFQTCFGENGITEKEIRELNESYETVIESMTGPNLLLSGSFARYFLFPFIPTFRNSLKHLNVMEKTLQKIIDRHKAAPEGIYIGNIIDAYYKEKQDKMAKRDPSAEYFTDATLIGSLIQFIGDGVLAVAVFIGAFFYTLIEHPEEQEKIYKELREVVGLERDPTMEDKNKLPYTNAFISEMLRSSNTFPFFPKMECTREVRLGGYRIPKGAVMVMNIWSSHHDPEVYEDPQKFNPSRFLGKDKLEQPILFGMGKRSCLGEGFTMAQVFLYLTTVLKHFSLSTPDQINEDTMLFFTGRLKICAHLRKEG